MCIEPPISSTKAIYTGRNLGRGSFCVVKEMMETHEDDDQIRCKDNYLKYFALKVPRGDLSSPLRNKVRLELQNEKDILSNLSHKFIIKVCHNINIKGHVYLAMERLPMTLDRKIKLWKTQRMMTKKFSCIPRRQSCPMNMPELWIEMIEVIQNIAHAMNYVHSQDVILRDLKPCNIGFNANGTLKLFDFGLARQLKDDASLKVGVDQYLLEQGAGSLRYMCPEVAFGRAYGKPCDVYSFAHVAWEILTMEKPYATIMTPESLHEQVYEQHMRPKVNKKWPAELQCLLHRSWYSNPRYRPQFSEISELLAASGLRNKNERPQMNLNEFARRICRSNHIDQPKNR